MLLAEFSLLLHPIGYASPSFIIPKAGVAVLPWWVNNYQKLNSITVPDCYPLPCIEDILVDCSKGKIWGKIDMTNSFFQTLVNPDHVKYTATLTPFGLWEWVVMPMGLQNALLTHQRHVMLALSELIGKICHVYLDNIIIWSSSLVEHKLNVSRVLEALHAAQLFYSLKKSALFKTEINFLGHQREVLKLMVQKWRKSLTGRLQSLQNRFCQFLGLVCYISSFLPTLAEHTVVLTPLTKKECNGAFPTWTAEHQFAFNAIKGLVLGRDCLISIDHQHPGPGGPGPG